MYKESHIPITSKNRNMLVTTNPATVKVDMVKVWEVTEA